jgi:hypothetical protein
MNKSELKQLIREEISKVLEYNLNPNEDDDVYGWYWPIADQGMEIIKKKGGEYIDQGMEIIKKKGGEYINASLGSVGDGDEQTYISIGIDFPNGSEEHFDVFFDENKKATKVESTWSS